MHITHRMRVAGLTILCAGALIMAIGLVMRGQEPAAARSPGQQEEVNREKAFALEFYKADALAQDPERAWEMMHDLQRKGHGRRDLYLQMMRSVRRMDVPADLQITEWRRPQQQGYTYLFQASELEPFVVVVAEDDHGNLSVLDSYYWDGRPLP